ncbi:unnamed protein product, partial [Amoebophrya sp. A25]|eukprot:GSA25T00019552001.1
MSSSCSKRYQTLSSLTPRKLLELLPLDELEGDDGCSIKDVETLETTTSHGGQHLVLLPFLTN